MKMSMNLNDQQRKYLIAAGIVAGAAALLTYPAILLYRNIMNRRNQQDEQGEDTQTKSFAPSYRGGRKHHRKAEANGHMHHA